MEGGCSESSLSELGNAPAASDGGASKFLANLPSRGNFSSTVLSSNLGESGSKAANHGSRKRAAEKALEGKAAGKKAMASTQSGSSPDLQSLTVERLRALLREKALPVTGRKDELIARLRGLNG